MIDKPTGSDEQGDTAHNADAALAERPALNSEQQQELETGKPGENTYRSNSESRTYFKQLRRWIKKQNKKIGLHDYLLVAFTGVLTIVAIWQGVLAYQNTHSSAIQFEQSQRPWVGFQDPSCDGCIASADPAQKLGTMHFYQKQYLEIGDLTSIVVNTGKTPASNVRIHRAIVQLTKNDPIPTWNSYTNEWANRVLSANAPNNKVIEGYANEIRGTLDPEFDLPPTVTHTTHLVQMPNMPYWRDAFGTEQLTVYVIAEIDYDDRANGMHHKTTLCLWDKLWRGGVSAFTYCQTGNTMD